MSRAVAFVVDVAIGAVLTVATVFALLPWDPPAHGAARMDNFVPAVALDTSQVVAAS